MPSPSELNLKGFSFQALFTSEGLQALDEAFLAHLCSANASLSEQLRAYRQIDASLTSLQTSELLTQCAPILESFVAELFNIEDPVAKLQASTLTDDPIFAFKKYFVLREARRHLKKNFDRSHFKDLNQWVSDQCRENNLISEDRELAVAQLGQYFLSHEGEYQEAIEKLIQWCVLAMTTEEGQQAVEGWMSFHLPKKLNYANLVDVEVVSDDDLGRLQGPPSKFRYRDGFGLTDPRMNAREALDEIHYCVYCHKNDGDFCSKGFPVKKQHPEMGLKISPVGEILTGCPLDEKISEMHVLKKSGFGIAALAMVMVDNPMCPATGHRICNDCMKACIYQKQEPVNIPQIETHILSDVLDLPWGVEIYDLLTRWNPLRQTQFVPKHYNGLKVLVMGMGPAGFTLAHHLLMEGFAVVGVDGLKLEPSVKGVLETPIYAFDDLIESLDDRVMAGFGGVAEYGITVRLDKNFLKLIYISLLRRPYFQVFGSVRFGGTIRIEDAWELGFDHLALAVGAGLPRELRIPNSLAPGMRQANDFLMALQLTGAAKKSSLANLQVRLPAVIIGGGLTGIDTATEVQAYYITQVEKTLYRYETLVSYFGESSVRERFNPHELSILDDFLEHGRIVREERERAKASNCPPNFIHLIRHWGGVTVAYRRSMQESPAYRRNHEEVVKALEEGIYYAEGLEPKSVILDEHGWVSALTCRWRVMDEVGKWMLTDEEQSLPARSIFVATGAQPNIAYEFENRGTFQRDGWEYQRHRLVNGKFEAVKEMGHVKKEEIGVFTSYERDHHRVSFLGDTHPVFHGSVVKAIASAKRAYPKIVESLKENIKQGDVEDYQNFRSHMEYLFRAKIISVNRHHKKLVELIVQAPMAARNFKPGQFYRLQNYETLAPMLSGTRLQTEALAMLGVRDPENPDQLSFMVFEEGASSRLVATFKPGDFMSVMGPTGARSKIPEDGSQTVMIIGGLLAIARLLSVGPALRQQGNRVLFVGIFNRKEDIYCHAEIEAAADVVVWITPEDIVVEAGREQDRHYHGDVISVLKQYANEGSPSLPLRAVNRVIIVGASDLIRTMRTAKDTVFKAILAEDVEFEAAVYGPMQCMLKGVCAQCLQWQIDPATGERKKAVYACSWQHQPMEKIDIDNIDERLGQNRSQEILTGLWLDYLFAEHDMARD